MFLFKTNIFELSFEFLFIIFKNEKLKLKEFKVYCETISLSIGIF